jgi:hypothetical protein
MACGLCQPTFLVARESRRAPFLTRSTRQGSSHIFKRAHKGPIHLYWRVVVRLSENRFYKDLIRAETDGLVLQIAISSPLLLALNPLLISHQLFPPFTKQLVVTRLIPRSHPCSGLHGPRRELDLCLSHVKS